MKTNEIGTIFDRFLLGDGQYVKVSNLDRNGIFHVAYIPHRKIETITYSDYGNFLAMIYTPDIIYSLDNLSEKNISLAKSGNLIINRPWRVFRRA